jgi:hypothetical protein
MRLLPALAALVLTALFVAPAPSLALSESYLQESLNWGTAVPVSCQLSDEPILLDGSVPQLNPHCDPRAARQYASKPILRSRPDVGSTDRTVFKASWLAVYQESEVGNTEVHFDAWVRDIRGQTKYEVHSEARSIPAVYQLPDLPEWGDTCPSYWYILVRITTPDGWSSTAIQDRTGICVL